MRLFTIEPGKERTSEQILSIRSASSAKSGERISTVGVCGCVCVCERMSSTIKLDLWRA